MQRKPGVRCTDRTAGHAQQVLGAAQGDVDRDVGADRSDQHRASKPPEIGLVNDDGACLCAFRFVSRPGGTCDAVVRSKTHRVGCGPRPAVSRLEPVDLGQVIDKSGNFGYYWVYRDGRPVAENVWFATGSKTAEVRRVQVGSCPRGRWARSRFTRTTRLPTRRARQDLLFVSPRTGWQCDYQLHLDQDGAIRVGVGDATYRVCSGFSLPGGGMGWIGPPPSNGHDRPLPVQTKRNGALGYQLSASTAAWRLERTIEPQADHIAVSDTLTNTTDELLGVRLVNQLRAPRPTVSVWPARPSPSPSGISTPERPLVQMLPATRRWAWSHATTCIATNRSVLVDAAGVGIDDDHFGLSPGESYTVRWEIYPVVLGRPFRPGQHHPPCLGHRSGDRAGAVCVCLFP